MPRLIDKIRLQIAGRLALDYQDNLIKKGFDTLVNAGDVARMHPPTLAENDDLETAMTLMSEVHEEHIGVVDNYDSRRLTGFVHERDVIAAYNEALVKMHRERGAAY